MADEESNMKKAVISKPMPIHDFRNTIGSRKHDEGDLLMGGILDGTSFLNSFFESGSHKSILHYPIGNEFYALSNKIGDDDLTTLRSTAKSAPPDLYLQHKASH